MKGRVVALFLVLAFLSASCASKKGLSRGEMDAALASSRTYVNSGLSVEEIEKLKPQAPLPMKLAVAPPAIPQRYGFRGEALDSWSSEETAEITSWEEPLKTAGIVTELIILPSMIVEQCRYDDAGCPVRARRAAAARVAADALLTISEVTAVDEYTNPSSILDLTIVGMWLVPGHHRDALTIAEGAMIDNRNEYLYVLARGEAEEDIVRPFAYADSWKATRPSRLRALRAFGQEFVKQASQLKYK